MPRRRRHPSLVPLSHDHREALGLAFRLHHPAPPGPVTAMTPASTPRSRADETLAFFARHLVPHFRAEEDVLFPFLRAEPAAGATAAALCDRLCGEHRHLETLREAIAAARDDDAALAAALGAFADLLEAHVRCEERELFEAFPEGLARDAVERLGAEIRAVLGTRPAR
jgi:hemerythrin superfamily protein